MRSVPERSVWLHLMVVLGGFAAGPLIGLMLGERMAPGSDMAQVASAFAFALAFFASIGFWLGLGIVAVVVGGVANLLRGRIPSVASLDTTETLVPPGYGAFVVFSLGLSTLAGALVGFVSETSWLATVALYAASGGAYGGVLWWLAHHGYLPFPEPE